MCAQPHRRPGFTLVEMAVVLVIIGLIAGGILVGRDLIHIAEIRRQATQIESLNVAVNAFKLKYKCLPGDCPFAAELAFGADGNGNGTIDLPADPVADGIDSSESENFWVHLSAANMVNGSYQAGRIPGLNSPSLMLRGQGRPPELYQNPAGGIWVVGSNVFTKYLGHGHYWFLTGSSADSLDVNNGIYSPADAYALDVKMDDGLPDSGGFRNRVRYQGVECNFGDCILQSPDPLVICSVDGRYNVTLTVLTSLRRLCAPAIRTAF